MFAVCVCACHDVLIRVGKYVATPCEKNVFCYWVGGVHVSGIIGTRKVIITWDIFRPNNMMSWKLHPKVQPMLSQLPKG